MYTMTIETSNNGNRKVETYTLNREQVKKEVETMEVLGYRLVDRGKGRGRTWRQVAHNRVRIVNIK